MAHLAQIKQSLLALIKRLDKNPVGAPFAESLVEILQILYTEEKATIEANFPLHAAATNKLAKQLGQDSIRLRGVCETDRCLGRRVCASRCPVGTIQTTCRESWTPPPKNATRKYLRIAKERGEV